MMTNMITMKICNLKNVQVVSFPMLEITVEPSIGKPNNPKEINSLRVEDKI